MTQSYNGGRLDKQGRGRMPPRLRGVSLGAMILSLAVSACTMGPDFKQPASPLNPVSWFGNRPAPSAASQPVPLPADIAWWESFNDPELNALEKRAATQNLDVVTATIRVVEAREQVSGTASGIFPTLSGSAIAADIKPSDQGLSFGGGSSAAGAGASSSISPFSFYQHGIDAMWTVDLWGKVRRQVEAGNAQLQATESDRRAQLIQTVAEVARDYIGLRNAQAQLAIANYNVKTTRDLLSLTQQRAAAGLTNDLDVAREQAQLDTVLATVPTAEQQVAAQINALSLLLGQGPNALRAELVTVEPVPLTPPQIPIGLPSELLRRRPDIAESEAKLHAATANIGVAVTEFFPTFNLLGSFGLQSGNTENLFNLAARTYILGGSISVPIFEGGKLVSQLRLRKAQQREAMVAYDKSVLQAFSDVDNALTAYDREQARRDTLRLAVGANEKALGLAGQRYREGIATYLDVLNAQQAVLSSQRDLQDSVAKVATNLVQLYLALGGGWEDTFPTPAGEAPPNASVGQTLKTAITHGNAS